MLYDLTTVKARQAVRVAKENLRGWERRFDRHAGDNQEQFISEIRAAEEQLAIARVSLRILHSASASPTGMNSRAVKRPSQDKAARPGASNV